MKAYIITLLNIHLKFLYSIRARFGGALAFLKNRNRKWPKRARSNEDPKI